MGLVHRNTGLDTCHPARPGSGPGSAARDLVLGKPELSYAQNKILRLRCAAVQPVLVGGPGNDMLVEICLTMY